MSVRVLLKFGHGLGDHVQFSVVLKHIQKYRHDWIVDVRCGRGKHKIFSGLCRHVYHDQESEPSGSYDNITDLGFFENYNNYTDRPCSKVTNCLAENFGLAYDLSLGRYQVPIGPQANGKAGQYLRSIGCQPKGGKYNAVIIHYEGNTSPHKKNLGHWQGQALAELAIRLGKVPVILDWDRRSPLPDNKRIFCPAPGEGDIWGNFGSGDAEIIAALIENAEAYIGIDSGPGKVASATNTKTLICWRGHHPIQFHDPAENTTHLVPEGHRRMPPCCDEAKIADYFEKHYLWRSYIGEHGLVAEAQRWLAEVLGMKDVADDAVAIKFVLPNGIGDVMWALTKIRSIASGRPIDIILSGNPMREIDRRAVPFLKRFPFVREVTVMDVPVLHDKENPANNRGRYNYVSDGPRGNYHFLIPNTALETGRRLEDWLEEHPTDWNVVNEFSLEGTQRGSDLGRAMAPFVALYLGPENGSTTEGHNRGWLWGTERWMELAAMLKKEGMNLCVVGAGYDLSMWEKYVEPGFKEQSIPCVNLIGKLEIGETFALLRESKCFISYQCGLGIVGHYLGVKVAMWWRPEGDSCHPRYLVSFDERMAHCWTRPGSENNYLSLIYRRQSPQDIMDEIIKRGWLK